MLFFTGSAMLLLYRGGAKGVVNFVRRLRSRLRGWRRKMRRVLREAVEAAVVRAEEETKDWRPRTEYNTTTLRETYSMFGVNRAPARPARRFHGENSKNR